jgi:acetylornithine deacetylase/succinyl-diaminopimelate desuccinylase-like protein
MMFVVRQLLEEEVRLPRPCVLAATVDEEFGMSGAHRLVQSSMAFSGAIVGEPTALKIIPAHDGQMYLKITVHGQAAHTSMPQNGINAIYLMDEVIAVLRRRAASEYPKRVHGLCGSPKLTISMIQGGVSEHIVPDCCEIAIDFRVIPGETCRGMLDEVKNWLTGDLDANTLQRIQSAEPHKAEPPMETSVDHPLVQGMREAAMAVLGDAQIQGVPYNTNASHYGAAGIPCVVFGPGGIGQAHSAVEYVEIGQLAAASEILRHFLMHGARWLD